MKQNINNFEMIEPGSGPMSEDDNSGAPPAAISSPRKNKVVTKEELEKSGMSLRDYLNAKQGLKRRKEKDPTAGDSPDKAAQEAADAIDPGRDMRTPRRYNNIMERPQADRDAMLKLGLQRQEAARAMKDFKAKKVAGMKSGGSVSSASSRADGCATKGKTKGTMITMKNGGKC
jgi:hypothetical protein